MATENTKIGCATTTDLPTEERLYFCCRDRDGVFDVFTIRNPQGEQIAHLYYWDEPDTNEGHLAEISAQLIVANLNRWYFSGWKDATHDLGERKPKIPRKKKR